MSSLTLVRHGQASFFAEDYDQLSALGHAQAGLLGDHWVRRRLGFDEVYVGPRTRQRQTAEAVGERYRQSGLPWPEPVLLPELDEIRHGQPFAPARPRIG
jgi:broad specificity phosphatase PhoE